jgi:hypothetical protein
MTPGAVRLMTPDEASLLIAGWNDAQAAASGEVKAPTDAEYEALVAKYG